MKRYDAIGVFGISGVGKTSLIAGFVGENKSYIHAQASVLIKEHFSQPSVSLDDLRTLGQEKIGSNQSVLVDAFRVFRMMHRSKIILLDAHSVIDATTGLLAVPTEVVAQLEIGAMIFVRGEPAEIKSHRKLDITRKRPIRTTIALRNLQEMALNQCQIYGQSLGLPLVLVRPGDTHGFQSAIQLIRTAQEADSQ